MHAARHVLRFLALLITVALGASLLAALPAQAVGTAAITGTVKDQDGKPLAGAVVSVQHPGQIGEPTVVTDAEGKYSVGNLASGVTYHVSASKSVTDPATSLRDVWGQVYFPDKPTADGATLFTLNDGQTRADVNFALTKRGRIAFSVKGSHGGPANFVSLVVRQSTNGGQTWSDRNEGQNTTQQAGYVQITPEPGYLYKFAFVPPGKAFAEDMLGETYDPVATEWWDNASSEATATPLGITAHGQDLINTVQLDRIVPVVTAPGKIARKAVKIAGTKKVGRTLSARTATWSPRPVKLSYTWYRNGKAIKGQTKRTYKLRNADQGKRITVRITGTKSGFTTASQLSAKTPKVRPRR